MDADSKQYTHFSLSCQLLRLFFEFCFWNGLRTGVSRPPGGLDIPALTTNLVFLCDFPMTSQVSSHALFVGSGVARVWASRGGP